MRKPGKHGLAIGVMAVMTVAGVRAQTVLHVDAQRGQDTQDGSAARPFATLKRAQTAIRDLKTNKAFPEKGVTVEVSGTFVMPGETVVFEASDGGTGPDAPVTVRAAKAGALFLGGRRLPAEGFRTVSDAAALARLPESVRGKVVVFDLKTAGITRLAPLPDKFSGWREMEIFSNGKAMRLARWPNTGWAEIARVIDRGVKPIDRTTGEWEFGVRGGTFEYVEDAPARWDVSKGIWMNGFWCHDWANETLRIGALDKEKKQITSAAIHTYGIGNYSKWHKAKRRYYVFNLLEELDAPGEW